MLDMPFNAAFKRVQLYRTWINIRGCHFHTVPRRQQALDATTTAQVEEGIYRSPNGQIGKVAARRPDWQNKIGHVFPPEEIGQEYQPVI